MKSLNPYLIAAKLVANRLLWDVNPESWRSRTRLRAIRGTRSGKAVILCNGPSLLNVDFDQLGGVYTFGLNKINLLFDKTAFRPDCIVSVNPYVLEQNQAFYRSTDIPLFLDRYASPLVGRLGHVTYLHNSGPMQFAGDVSLSLNQGYTVTFVAMQLAFHLGFRQVAVVGCDHSFAAKGTPNSVATAHGPDQSHFDPNYFSGGAKWQLPDLLRSEIAYLMALEGFQNAGGGLWNCTEGGKLEVLPRRTLSDFLSFE